MLRRYSQILRDAISDRTIEAETELLTKEPRYRELNVKLCELLDTIERNLPPEMQHLIFELDNLMTEQGTLETRTMYEQGLNDRFNLERFWIKILGMRSKKSGKEESKNRFY
ncbi:MAG TPA: hypothetical protein DDW50_02190 [Firmicutes bacterium]|jgi:hypothetical protein|nr:hypothetical protein [Bacillota bacterium]